MLSIRKRFKTLRKIQKNACVSTQVTDTGCHRGHNEDAVYYRSFEEGRHTSSLSIVADGMGGHAAGEVASQLAVQTISSFYNEDDSASTIERLVTGFQKANHVIWQKAQQDSHMTGMGTTCSALVIREGKACFVHIGDSRIYLLRDQKLDQLTRDDTLLNALIDQQQNTDNVPRNILSKALGISFTQKFQKSASPITIRSNDRFLLCSDGLYDKVTDEEIRELMQIPSIGLAAESMLSLAKERGGEDNISIIINEVL